MHPFLKNKPHVPPSGPPHARIAAVGEQPGVEEIRRGKPFIGPAGEEWDVELHMATIPRMEVYVTNTIKDLTHPLKYYINIPSKLSQQVKISEEGYQYLDVLKHELIEVNPNVVICIGGVATYALTSRRGIYRWRGSILESTLVPGLKCIPTLHPATVIPPKNVFLNRYLIAMDMKKALAESYSSDIRYESRLRAIEADFTQCRRFLVECIRRGKSGTIIDLDIEVVNDEMSCISFAWDPYNSMSIPFFYSQGDYFTVDQEAEIMQYIAMIYEDEDITIRGQNHIFDTNFQLAKYGIKPRGRIHDTMIAQKIIYPDFKANLGFINSMHTDIPYYKDEGKKWLKVGGPWKEFWIYNCNDSLVTAEAGPKQMKELESQNNVEVYDRHCKLIYPLLYMQERGIKVNVQGMKDEHDRTDREIDKLEEELWRKVGYEINYNSHQQVKEYFYEQLGIKPYRKRNTKGQYIETVDENALKRIAKGTTTRPAFEEARLILNLRGLRKRNSVYLEVGKVDKDGRYRSAYNPVGAKTGRLSSSETIFGTGGNQQNWPHDLLRYLTFDEGYAGYSIDLGQAENRIVAYVGNIIPFIEAFENGRCTHRLTASFIMSKPYDEISNEDGSSHFGNGRQSERYWGKKCNYELTYGMGYKKFALEYELPESEAKYMFNTFHSTYPGIKGSYQLGIRQQLFKNRTITNLMGRNRIFLGDIEGVTRKQVDTFNEAYSHMAQSTVADVINERGLNYIYYNQQWFRLVELLTQTHDSIVFQIPLSIPFTEHATILIRLVKNLEQPLSYHDRSFIIPADVSTGKNMYKGEQTEISGVSSMTVSDLTRRLENIWQRLEQ